MELIPRHPAQSGHDFAVLVHGSLHADLHDSGGRQPRCATPTGRIVNPLAMLSPSPPPVQPGRPATRSEARRGPFSPSSQIQCFVVSGQQLSCIRGQHRRRSSRPSVGRVLKVHVDCRLLQPSAHGSVLSAWGSCIWRRERGMRLRDSGPMAGWRQHGADARPHAKHGVHAILRPVHSWPTARTSPRGHIRRDWPHWPCAVVRSPTIAANRCACCSMGLLQRWSGSRGLGALIASVDFVAMRRRERAMAVARRAQRCRDRHVGTTRRGWRLSRSLDHFFRGLCFAGTG